MKKPSGRAPKRSPGRQPQRRVIRVLTEGEVTEPHYLTLLARKHRHTITIQHDKDSAGSAPLTLVQEARRQQKASKRRRKSDGPDFDEIWCAFDTDEHLNIAQAIAEARDAEVKVARSNPCSELWLVLHVEDHNANVHRHDIQRRATDLGLTDGKSICGTEAEETLMANTQSAVDRAQHIDDRHGNDGSPAGENPSSGMWRLVEAIEQNK
ncbi:MAG: RloB domain-containing protein [Actinomycetia bacterium]|nr:RloB domain-containing protein [Actinomycetes bacterium]